MLETSDPLRVVRGVVHLAIHAQPGARREGLAGLHGGRLKLKVTAPAEAGRANDALLALVARELDVPRSAVTLASGASARTKELALEGLDLAEARRRLARAVERA